MRVLRILLLHIIIVAAGVTIFVFSYAAYREAGKHLTPASVHVSGYHHRDGSYVSAYNRRPPGGVAHDAPYESRRSSCVLGMVVGIVLATVPFITLRPYLLAKNSVPPGPSA